MKKLLFFIFFSPIFLFAQSPNGISYQGVATDQTGVELTNQNISLKASILSSTANRPFPIYRRAQYSNRRFWFVYNYHWTRYLLKW